jgi:uncharacterized protein YbaP (TraB family)
MLKGMFLSMLAFIGVGCSSQPKTDYAPNNNSLLWEISGNGLKQPSYFFGTMHILCADDAKLSQNFTNIINGVGQIYFEIKLDDMAQTFGMIGDLPMKDNKTLKDFYTDAEYAKVKNYFDKHGQMPFMMMEKFKPMLLSSMVEEEAMPCKEKDGMEMRIMQLAQAKKTEIKGLETMHFQASIFDSIPYEDQAKELLESIDSIPQQNLELAKMTKAYISQNLDSLNDMTSADASMAKYLDLMLFGRNRNWAKQFDAIAKEKSTLFAVGAGHLGGEKGVLNLLRKKGYTVKPLKN